MRRQQWPITDILPLLRKANVAVQLVGNSNPVDRPETKHRIYGVYCTLYSEKTFGDETKI